MDMLATLLLWLHFMALALGGTATFGIPVVAAWAGAQPEGAGQPLAATLVPRLVRAGHIAIGLLILTGLLLIWTGSAASAPVWFWVKLVLVAALLASIVTATRLNRRIAAGERALAALMPRLSRLNIVLLAAIVASAVLAFE